MSKIEKPFSFDSIAGGVGLTAGGVGPTAGGVGLTAGGIGPTAGGIGPTAGGIGTTAGGGFDQLARRHKDAVYRQMVRVCGNREDAEDVLIEALLKAYRSLDALTAHEAFRTWLGRIASRVCWQLRRRQALLPLLQLSALEENGIEVADSSPSAETQVAAHQLKEMLHAALRSLPASYRAVYELRAIDELSGEETAQRLGISITAMKSRWHRARTLLRMRLDHDLAPANELNKSLNSTQEH